MWFLTQLEPESSAYHIPIGVAFHGKLDIAAVCRAINMIISRHEVLQYSFVNDKGTPSIKVKESVELPVVDRDVGGEAAEVDATIREFIADPFDLSEAPLMRAAIFRRGERDGTLVFVLHHLVCDGWSLGVLIEEFNSIYNQTVCQEGGEEAVLPYQYCDWSEWQIGRLEGGAFDAGLEYWRGRLADLEELSLDGFQASALADEVKDNGYVQLDLNREVVADLDRACRTRGLTRFAALLAAFCAVLYRLSGKETFGVGVPVSGRDEFGTHKLIGLFVNTVVLRQDISGELDIWELVERTQAEIAAGLQHGDVPFEEVVRALEPDRHLAATPLCNVMFAYDKIHRSSLRLAGLDTTPMDLRNEDPKIGLSVRFDEDEYGTTIGMEYRCSFVSHKTIETLARQFETALGLMIQGNPARIGNIELLGAAQSKREISEASGGSLSVPGIDAGIEDYICKGELIADRLAIVSGGKSVTYQKLRQVSENIAQAVLEHDPGPEECVGILSTDPMYSVIGIMSTLRAGCAFVIVDQEEPSGPCQGE